MDSGLNKDDGYTVAYTSSEMPAYTSAQYSADISGYYTELDWQNGSLDPSRSMYTIASRQDVSPLPYYPDYQPASHAEVYQSSVLWPEGALHVTGSEASMSHGISLRRDSARSGSSIGRPKRRRTQSMIQRRAANVRERRRMFQLNEAFDELRKKLPAFNYEKRLSRIETLRLAMTYISFMQDVTTGTDPKHVKLLKYQTEDSNHHCELGHNSSGCQSPEDLDHIEYDDGKSIRQPPTLIEVSQQPVLIGVSDSAVHVELLPSVPTQISLPVTNHVVLTETEVKDESQEKLNATCNIEMGCPSN